VVDREGWVVVDREGWVVVDDYIGVDFIGGCRTDPSSSAPGEI